jgi:uncharacterized protein YjaG (DUF416 family)
MSCSKSKVNTEQDVNKLGFYLIEQKKFTDATFIFRMNLRFYPNFKLFCRSPLWQLRIEVSISDFLVFSNYKA